MSLAGSLRARRRRRTERTMGEAPTQILDARNPWEGLSSTVGPEELVDLQRRREQLTMRAAELQWDLGGLAYEMAIRDRVRVDLLVQRAAALQAVDAELGEVERILLMEQTRTAGVCATCGAPHSSGAGFCWQCGQPLLATVSTDAIGHA